MIYGAIDIGTNSCRLLIAEIKGETLQPLHSELQTTRIGEGLNRRGYISEKAMERNISCLGSFKNRLQEFGASEYRAIATSAVREAHNGLEFVKLAEENSRIKVDIVSGEEEAALSYLGVEKELNTELPPLVVDLGGGSTEFICNEQNFVCSLPLGAVRATELGMSAQEMGQLIDSLGETKVRFASCPLVFVGGTASSLAAVNLGLTTFDSRLVHGHCLSRDELAELYRKLDSAPLARRRQIPGLQPERADIIVSGALIMLVIMDKLGKTELLVSESDLLQGIIWSSYLLPPKS